MIITPKTIQDNIIKKIILLKQNKELDNHIKDLLTKDKPALEFDISYFCEKRQKKLY